MKVTKAQLIILTILILGLIVGLILSQKKQILKSKADEQIFNNLQVTGAHCDSPDNGQSNCQMDQPDSKVSINGVQKLKELAAPE